MAIVARPLTEIPKRTGRPRKFDAALADTLLKIISQNGQTATDEQKYENREDAMKVAALHKRTVQQVAPDSMRIRTRVYPVDGGFAWVVFGDTAKAEKAAKK